MLTIYNSLSRKEEPLPDQKKIRLFVCGPTVYDYLHIGNARTYIFFDFFAKYLRARGYDVTYVQNITDIDDKIIRRAAEEHKEPAVLAKHFTEAYFEDMKALSVDAVSEYAAATNFISQITAQVERLIDKGFAYKIDDDGWYFDISKDPDYGKLSGRTVEQAEDGVTRIDESVNKKNKGDFCLWKFSTPGEPAWPSSLSEGRPGWHIEDTAISEFYFGPQYEIHGGALDLKFPHHEAEIAQQESASGLKPFVRLWIHAGLLTVESKKMSKSVGNFMTIRDFLAMHPAVVLRWIVLSHHYRSPLDFSERVVAQAKSELENLYTLALHAKKAAQEASESTDTPVETTAGIKWKKAFHEALDEDLNTPKAFSIVFEMLKDKELSPGEKVAFLKTLDRMAMLDIKGAVGRVGEIPAEITKKFQEYEAFRTNKQFIQSDALRKELEGVGYEVRDGADGSSLVKKFFS
ncbi:MAG TPA: cysteine--tRNA ligase [Candidatus Paceibacterota bacterium]